MSLHVLTVLLRKDGSGAISCHDKPSASPLNFAFYKNNSKSKKELFLYSSSQYKKKCIYVHIKACKIYLNVYKNSIEIVIPYYNARSRYYRYSCVKENMLF